MRLAVCAVAVLVLSAACGSEKLRVERFTVDGQEITCLVHENAGGMSCDWREP